MVPAYRSMVWVVGSDVLLWLGWAGLWLELDRDLEDTQPATEEQVAFVREVRRLLDAAGTPGLDRRRADAGVGADVFDRSLLIILPRAMVSFD